MNCVDRDRLLAALDRLRPQVLPWDSSTATAMTTATQPSQRQPAEQNMAKLVALMKIRPDISLAAAQSLYEEEHVPLVMNLMPIIREYRRNYLTRSDAVSTGWPDFDVITELWFDSTADLESFVHQMQQGEVGRRLRADSARFLVAGTTRLFVVDERRIESARELAC